MTGRSLLIRGGAGGLRALALASRFGFILAAAFFMEPTAFGIYGLIAAGSYVLVQIAGIEAYAEVMRRIATTRPGCDGDDRPFYGRFVVLSAALAFAGGTAMGLGFGWPPHIALLAGAIVALEYTGVEAGRILVAEDRADLALLAASLRLAPWSLGFPLLAVAGLMPGPWPLEWVLAAWIACATASLGLLTPVARRYAGWADRPFWPWYRDRLRLAPRWLAIALAPRFLESGVRLVPGLVIDDAAAGRFILLATLAGIGAIAVRSVIEPFYFAAMLDPRTGTAARRRFARTTGVMLALGALASGLGWWALPALGGRDLGPDSGATLMLLVVAAGATSLAQVAHFRLYAQHRDRDILRASLIALLFGLPAVTGLTLLWQTPGTALGAALGALVFLALKAAQARHPAAQRRPA